MEICSRLILFKAAQASFLERSLLSHQYASFMLVQQFVVLSVSENGFGYESLVVLFAHMKQMSNIANSNPNSQALAESRAVEYEVFAVCDASLSKIQLAL